MPEYERVLVPTDGSEGVDRTLDHAVRLAADHGARVHALSVVDRRLTHAAADAREDVTERLVDRAEGAVRDVADRVEAAGLTAETAVREGVPDKEIAAYAEEADVDVIVIGTHGRTGRDRIANLGSVTERVVQNADRPVFVIHIQGGD
ncbi:MAG: universal stress protein [Haloferacaceae archaeon]